LCTIIEASAQTGTINSCIADENGIVVLGASVSIDGLRKGGFSNFDGTFIMVSCLKENRPAAFFI